MEHILQLLSFTIFIVFHVISFELRSNNLPINELPTFKIIFMASAAWVEPIIPTRGEKTPWSAHLNSASVFESGNKHS